MCTSRKSQAFVLTVLFLLVLNFMFNIIKLNTRFLIALLNKWRATLTTQMTRLSSLIPEIVKHLCDKHRYLYFGVQMLQLVKYLLAYHFNHRTLTNLKYVKLYRLQQFQIITMDFDLTVNILKMNCENYLLFQPSLKDSVESLRLGRSNNL